MDDDYQMGGELWKHVEDVFPDPDDTDWRKMNKPENINLIVGIWESLKTIVYHNDCNLRARSRDPAEWFLAGAKKRTRQR